MEAESRVWDYEGMRRDLRLLAEESCVQAVLVTCTSLLDLPPVREIVSGAHQSARAYILQDFLRRVVDHADNASARAMKIQMKGVPCMA